MAIISKDTTRKQVIDKIQDKLKDPLVLECNNDKDYNSETGQTKTLKMIIGTPLIARKSNKKYKIAKNEMYYVIDINTTITLKELEDSKSDPCLIFFYFNKHKPLLNEWIKFIASDINISTVPLATGTEMFIDDNWNKIQAELDAQSEAYAANELNNRCYELFPGFNNETGKCLELAAKGQEYQGETNQTGLPAGALIAGAAALYLLSQ